MTETTKAELATLIAQLKTSRDAALKVLEQAEAEVAEQNKRIREYRTAWCILNDQVMGLEMTL